MLSGKLEENARQGGNYDIFMFPALKVSPQDGLNAVSNWTYWTVWVHFQDWEQFQTILVIYENPPTVMPNLSKTSSSQMSKPR